jgi:hypothetical protein
MKKLIFLPLLIFSIYAFGQKQIVVQNGTARSFESLTMAIDSANAGDTIYIPGGGFNILSSTIDKTLHWRGVGHYPDSTTATGHTQITSTLYFTGNCDNSTFEGIYFSAGLTFGSTDDEAINIKIKRCHAAGITLRKITEGNPDLYFQITESVIANLNGKNASRCLVEKSLLFGTIQYFHWSIFNHNSTGFNRSTYSDYSIGDCINCQFKNNVFAYGHGFYRSKNCNLQYNMFVNALPYNATTSVLTGNNNIEYIGYYNSFVEGGALSSFSYVNDYHLKAGSPGIGAAEDGTNIGIYGTTMPYKDGAVPYSPHIRLVDIENQAVNGELGVKITVAAQEK